MSIAKTFHLYEALIPVRADFLYPCGLGADQGTILIIFSLTRFRHILAPLSYGFTISVYSTLTFVAVLVLFWLWNSVTKFNAFSKKLDNGIAPFLSFHTEAELGPVTVEILGLLFC